MSDLADELERFRNAWRQEVSQSTEIAAPTLAPSTSAHVQTPTNLTSHVSTKPLPVTDLQHYEYAITAEAEGKMNEALLYYRKAFKMNPEIDKLYHNSQQQKQPLQPEDDLSFKFARTLQLGPDYVQPSHKIKDDSEDHPLSTATYIKTLVKSFEQHPFEHPISGQITEFNPNNCAFIPRDISKPVQLNKLPDEILSTVLLELTLPNKVEHFPKVALIEAFALTCRKARLISLTETSMYRTACRMVYKPPFQVAPLLTAREEEQAKKPDMECDSICTKHYQGDWRRFWLEHPRLRTDGCFISVVSYVRRGESENAWVAPSHIVVYYRFIRFLSNGQCISLVTTLSPSEIARSLDADLRMKGLQIGKWQLRGDAVSCWGLEDLYTESSGKYWIEMSYKLKSTSRGKMNKLTLNYLRTANKRTGERVDVPLQHNKAFYFSMVRSYEK